MGPWGHLRQPFSRSSPPDLLRKRDPEHHHDLLPFWEHASPQQNEHGCPLRCLSGRGRVTRLLLEGILHQPLVEPLFPQDDLAPTDIKSDIRRLDFYPSVTLSGLRTHGGHPWSLITSHGG